MEDGGEDGGWRMEASDISPLQLGWFGHKKNRLTVPYFQEILKVDEEEGR